MKKFLSLVLALVMTMSLVTISAGAKDFTDDEKITYDEAIAVISAIGVVDGYADGSFNPQATLTRGAAAKIICNLILGPTTAVELSADTAPYSDVPTTHTFAGYIAYCQKAGIISGYADGTFRPAGTLTGYAFMKMLLGALGYDKAVEGYEGANWSINVAKRALGIGLNAGLNGDFNGVKAVTREEACLYAFNTLKADLVEYDTKTNISIGGAEVVLTGSEAKAMTWNNSATRKSNIKDDDYIQFAEQYFNKLNVDSDDVDAFGRPANTWTYNTEDIGTYVDRSLLIKSFTDSVEGGEAYSVIGANAVKNYDLLVWVDGVASKDIVKADLAKNNGDDLPKTDKGVLTEIYVDNDAEEITIAIVNTYLAEVAADYNEKAKTLSLSVYTAKDTAATYKAELENVANLPEFEDGDMVLVTMSGKNKVIRSVEEAEVVGNVAATAYTSGSSKMKTITADGTKYSVAAKAFTDGDILYNYTLEQLDGYKYDLYLDPYGNVIGIEETEAADNYAFVVGYQHGSSVLAKAVDKALVIFTDGTMQTVDVTLDKNMAGSDKTALGISGGTKTDVPNVHRWFTYTVDEKGDYTLKAAVAEQAEVTKYQAAHGADIDDKNTSLYVSSTFGYAYGNDDSTYITVKANTDVHPNGSIVDVRGIVTGIKNTSIEADDVSAMSNFWNDHDTYFMYDEDGYVTYAVVVGQDSAVADNYVYLTSGVKQREYISGVGYVDTYEAIVNGKAATILVDSDASNTTTTKLTAHTLYQVSYDKDGYVIDTAAPSDHTLNTASNKAGYAFANNPTVTLQGATLWVTNSADNEGYIVVDKSANFFVKNDEGDYDEYTSARSALNAATADDTVGIAKIVAICDKNSGYGTTVIFDVTYAGDVPAGPIVSTDYDVSTKIVGTSITVNAKATESSAAILDIAIAELQAQGYSNIVANSDTAVSAVKSGVTKNFTIHHNKAYKVTFTTADSNVVCSPASIYLAGGDVVKVEVTNGYADWDTIRTWTVSGVTATCGTATGTGEVQTVSVTMGAIAADSTATMSWT